MAREGPERRGETNGTVPLRFFNGSRRVSLFGGTIEGTSLNFQTRKGGGGGFKERENQQRLIKLCPRASIKRNNGDSFEVLKPTPANKSICYFPWRSGRDDSHCNKRVNQKEGGGGVRHSLYRRTPPQPPLSIKPFRIPVKERH